MGLFSRGKTAEQKSDSLRRPDRSRPEGTFEVYRPSGLAVDYPEASPEELDLMARLAVTLHRERGGGSFTEKQLAIISTLCERLVAGNSELAGFVEFLREVSRSEHAADPGSMSWRWLAREL